MSEVHVGNVSSDVSLEESNAIETPRADEIEGIDKLEAMRARAAAIRERTAAWGFDD